MYYILRLTPGKFVYIEDDILITSNVDKLQKFNTIGDAMRAAVKVNSSLGTYVCKVERILQ